jgi:hypothetical protein
LDGVTRAQREGVGRLAAHVEDGGLRRHVAVNHTELFRVGVPADVVDGALLVCVVLACGSKTRVHKILIPRSIRESKAPLALSRYRVVSP